jgi:hypothetical protein
MHQIPALKQTRSIDEYIEKFEDLRHQLLLHDPSASIVFFVARFLDGLHDEIWSVISIHRPQDMDTVCPLVLMQEEASKGGKHKSVMKTDHQSTRSNWKFTEKLKDHKKADDGGQKSEDKLASLLAYRKTKGLCFKCGDKWGKGHTCPAQVPMYIVEEMLSIVHQSGSAMPVQNEESDSDEGLELLAVQQGKGQPPTKVRGPTMRLLGWVGKHQALILVDSRSASTFVSTPFAEKCGMPMEQYEYS